ncbi:MAG: tRNA pseudouridine(55) synthase TruB [Thiobacillaceae bacterium]
MPRQFIDGVLLLNKPAGLSSNAALQKVKRLYNAAKAGHSGTLDPFATGLLPVCFGQATKFAGYALHGDKTYRAVLKLGVTTTTGDTEGAITETRPVAVSREAVEAILPRFRGTIRQTPPMHSALKHQGKPLYEYARAGIVVERKAREITIFRLRAESLEKDLLSIDVHCSGGTYIRTLAEDMGKALGCGAHLIALERTASGLFSLTQTVSLEALESLREEERLELLLTPDALVAHLPSLNVDAEAAQQLTQGKHIHTSADLPDLGMVRVYAPLGFLGLASSKSGKLVPSRLMATGGAA